MAFKVLPIVLILTAVTTSTAVQYFDKFQSLRNALRQSFGSLAMEQDKNKDCGDCGVVNNCVGTPGPPFSLKWEPKVINPEGHITVYYDYTIPYDFKQGTLDVELFFDNIPTPIFQDTFPVDCSKVGKYVKCPMKKGTPFKGTYPYSNLLVLKGYDGTYTGILKLKNGQNQLMLCANATVKISSNDLY